MLRTLLTAAAFTLAASLAAAQDLPQLKREAVVAGEIVRVGDLLGNAGALADIAVFRAPDPGHVGSVPVGRVLAELRRHGVTEVDAGGIAAVSVSRLSRRIPAKEIEEQIAAALAGHAGLGSAARLAITFDRDVRPLDLDLDGELRIARASYNAQSSRFDVVFETTAGGSGRRAVLHYSGVLVETVDVAVPSRALQRGEVIRESDVAIARRPKAAVAAGALARLDQVVGLAARHAIPAAQPLRAADLMKPEWVRQNEAVLVTYETAGLTLTLRAQALGSGAEGDTVSVLNPQSKRTMQGVVIGPNRVKVESLTPRILAGEPLVTGSIPSRPQPRTE